MPEAAAKTAVQAFSLDLPFDRKSGRLKLEKQDETWRNINIKLDYDGWHENSPLYTSVDLALVLSYYAGYGQTHITETQAGGFSRNLPLRHPHRETTVREFGFIGIVEEVKYDVQVPARLGFSPYERGSIDDVYKRQMEFSHNQRLAALELINERRVPWLRHYANAGTNNVGIVGYVKTEDGKAVNGPSATMLIDADEPGAAVRTIEAIADCRDQDECFAMMAKLMIERSFGGD